MAYEEHWQSCTLALRFNGTDIADDKGHALTNNGVSLSSAVSDSGGKSGYFNGSAKIWITQSSPIAEFGEGDFTVAFSFYIDQQNPNGPTSLIDVYAAANAGLLVEYANTGTLSVGTPWGGTISASGIALDTLYRCMFVRSGDTGILFVDGDVAGTSDLTGYAVGDPSGEITLGGGTLSHLYGYLDEVYFIPGVALETAAYTPGAIFANVPEPGPQIPLSITVAGYGTPDVPISVSVGEIGACSAQLSVSVIDADYLSGGSIASDGGTVASAWFPSVNIGGVDVTDDIVGPVTVEGSEGDARIATFSLAVAAGTEVAMADYVGKTVLIEITDGLGNNAMRLFSGILDLPTIDLRARTVACACTDDLQNRIAATTTAFLDGLIGGRWSPAIFAKGSGSWRYAQDQLSTVASSLDLSAFGQMRVTGWQAKTAADLEFNADDVLDGSVVVDFAERSRLVNQVDIDFGYRFPRMKSEGHHINFSYMTNGFSAWVAAGNGFLFRTAVVAAIENAGGSIVSIAYIPLPTTAQVVGGGFWIPNPATDPLMCLGFDAVVSYGYTQDVDETHSIRVYNDSSISAVGLIRDRISGALEGVAFDSLAVETSALLYGKGISKIPPPASVAVVSGSTNAESVDLTAETDRSAAEAAMETLIDIAKTKIAASHRSSSVSAAVPLHPLIDVDKTILVSAQGVAAKGKCTYFRHNMDAASGEATTDFRIALCSLLGLGIADPGDPTVAPPGTGSGVTSELDDPICVYDGLFGHDQSFTVTFPAVDSDERNAFSTTIATEIMAPLVEDLLTISM